MATGDFTLYQSNGSYVYDLPTFTWQSDVPRPKEIEMKGNGKEFLVFVKGGVAPVKACETEAEALEEASALADKNDDVYFVYRAIKRVAPVRKDLEVSEL